MRMRARSGGQSVGRTMVLVSAAGLVVGLAASGAMADPDWRKLQRITPYTGPGFVNGQWVNADGSAAPAPGGVVDNVGVTLKAHLTLGMFSTFSGANVTNGNDCWGYISPSGREYAIVGLGKGFGVVEVTNPASPVIIKWIPGATSTWHDVKVIGQHAYGVSEGGLGIQVIDMSQADAGVVTLVKNKTQAGHTTTHNIAANTSTGFLYLCGANISNGGLVAVSTTNPTEPTIVGAWPDRYVHDAQVVSFTSGPNAGKEIAYCANETRVDIVDVTNKNAMVTIGTAFYPSTGYTHQGWLSGDRKYWYANDELDELNGLVTTTASRIFNVENLTSPFYVGSYTSGVASIDHNNYWHNGRIFQANYTSGLRVFDACIPTAPVQVGWYDTSGQSGNSFNGAWSVYPYFPSGTVIVSDIQGGLFVFEITAGAAGAVQASLTSTPTQLAPSTPTPISADVTVCGTTVQSVTLNVKVDNGPVQSYPMSNTSGTIWSGNIPGSPCLSTVDYFVQAQGAGGQNSQTPTINASVFTSINTTFSDNFQTNTGWTTEILGATSGQWERGVPVNDPNWEYDPTSDSDGSGQCYLTQNAPGNTDVDNGSVRLTSPTLDLSGNNVSFTYDYFLNLTDASTDLLRVEINTTNGTGAWTQIAAHQQSNGLAWTNSTISAAQLASLGVTPTATTKVRFTANDANPQSIVEAGLDAVKVQSKVCDNPCYADCDGSGSLNVFDYICFGNAYAAQQSYADCDNNGSFNVFDYICFGNAYAAGCP